MNIEGNVVASVLSALAIIGSGIGWLIARHDKKKDPLPKAAAEVALAREALGIVSESAQTLKEDLARIKADREEDRTRIDQLEKDGVADRARISRLESLLSHAASYIEALLRWAHGLRGAPKPPPLPSELHDLVDPHLWVTVDPNREQGSD